VLAKKGESFSLVNIKEAKIDFTVFEKGSVVFSLSSDEKVLSEKTAQKAKECFNYYFTEKELGKIVIHGSKEDMEESKKFFGKKAEFRENFSGISIPKKKEFSSITNKKSNYASLLGVSLRGAKKNLYD